MMSKVFAVYFQGLVKFMKTKNILFAIFISCVCGLSYAASFDCNKATSFADKTVCENSDLSSLDEKNASLYKQASLIDKSSAKALRAESYRERQACGFDVQCIESAYKNSMDIYRQIIDSKPSADVNIDQNNSQSSNSEKNKVVSAPVKVNTGDFISDNKELILFGSYLLLVLFLRYAKENPELSIMTVKFLYLVVGFPFIATVFVIKKLLKLKSSNIDSGNSLSSGSSHQQKEQIEIQYQLDSGAWQTYSSSANNDAAISKGMEWAQKGLVNKPGITGRLRARGKKTGNIYAAY